MSKRRVVLFLDEEIWRELNSILNDNGYPRGVPSWIAQRAFKHYINQLKYIGSDTELELFFNKKT